MDTSCPNCGGVTPPVNRLEEILYKCGNCNAEWTIMPPNFFRDNIVTLIRKGD